MRMASSHVRAQVTALDAAAGGSFSSFFSFSPYSIEQRLNCCSFVRSFRVRLWSKLCDSLSFVLKTIAKPIDVRVQVTIEQRLVVSN